MPSQPASCVWSRMKNERARFTLKNPVLYDTAW